MDPGSAERPVAGPGRHGPRASLRVADPRRMTVCGHLTSRNAALRLASPDLSRLRRLALLSIAAASCAGDSGSTASLAEVEAALDEWTVALDAQIEACGGWVVADFEPIFAVHKARYEGSRPWVGSDTNQHEPEPSLSTTTGHPDMGWNGRDVSTGVSIPSGFDSQTQYYELSAEVQAALDAVDASASWSVEELDDDDPARWVRATNKRAAALDALVAVVLDMDPDDAHVIRAIEIPEPSSLVQVTMKGLYTHQPYPVLFAEACGREFQAAQGARGAALLAEERVLAAEARLSRLAAAVPEGAEGLQGALGEARAALLAAPPPGLEPETTARIMAEYFALRDARVRRDATTARLAHLEKERSDLDEAWRSKALSPFVVESRWLLKSELDALRSSVDPLDSPEPESRSRATARWNRSVKRAKKVLHAVRIDERVVRPRSEWKPWVERRLATFDRLIDEANNEGQRARRTIELIEGKTVAAELRASWVVRKRYDTLREAGKGSAVQHTGR